MTKPTSNRARPSLEDGHQRLVNPQTVVGGLASVPERSTVLEGTVSSIIDQVDHLHVYLNNYSDIPTYLKSPKITVYISDEYGDLADNGKFFGLANHPDGIYFTFDDDIIYPADYVKKMSDALHEIEYAGIVGVHGVYYPANPRSFWDRRVLHFKNRNPELRPVSLLGTGTVAFPIELLKFGLDIFRTTRLADVWFAIHAKALRLPMFAVARPNGWLKPSDLEPGVSTIWRATKDDPSQASEAIVDHRPWGMEDLLDRIARMPSEGAPQGWSAFARFWQILQSVESPPPAPELEPSERMGEHITFYCDAKDLVSAARIVYKTASRTNES